MKKVLIIALTVLCGAATAAIIGLNSKSDLSELTKANIEALTGIVVRPKSGCYSPRDYVTVTTIESETNPSTGTTTTTSTQSVYTVCKNETELSCVDDTNSCGGTSNNPE